MNTGEKIKIMRQNIGMTQYELSKQTSLSQSQISKIEQGKRKITDIDLKRMAKALHISIQELLG